MSKLSSSFGIVLAGICALLVAQGVEAADNNLIANPSMQVAQSNTSRPERWLPGSWGELATTFTYPVSGNGDDRAGEVRISQYSSGDAKWYFAEVPVKAGEIYTFSDFYKSNVESEVVVQYRSLNGQYTYEYLDTLAASANWQGFTKQFTVPAGVVAVTVFHSIYSVGTLTTDNYSLSLVGSQAVTPSTIVTEVPTETSSTISVVPVATPTPTPTITPTPTVEPTSEATITVTPTPAPTPTEAEPIVEPTPEPTPTPVIETPGEPVTQPATETPEEPVAPPAPEPTPVPVVTSNTGLVSLNFDDGWLSDYTAALPIMQNAGITGTYYITTHNLGTGGYMTRGNVLDIQAAGFEIGAHTLTHPHLPLLSPAQQQAEIGNARTELLNMGVNSVTTFAYPFGEYNATTVAAVQATGFSNARTTDAGYSTSGTNRYLLQVQNIEVTTPLSQVRSWIDHAMQTNTWLILVFHQIDYAGGQYSYTPDNFQQVVNYLTQKGVRVVNMAQGLNSVQ